LREVIEHGMAVVYPTGPTVIPVSGEYTGAVQVRGLSEVARLAAADARLRLLVLFGSRARGDARVDSDWDFGYLADPGFDPDVLLAALVRALETNSVDLVDLARASGQLRYRAAADGIVVCERGSSTFTSFWFGAVSYWCDMQSVIRAEYEGALKSLSA
jgi:predicted nucleotidyltransferase